jgi:hypothetical protein
MVYSNTYRKHNQARQDWLHLTIVLVIFILLNIGKEWGLIRANNNNLNELVQYYTTNGFSNFALRQKHAQQALEVMDAEGVFDTILTSRESVLQKGFPFQWEPCSLPRIFRRLEEQDDSRPLQMAFLGGSATAAAAAHCGIDEQNHQDMDAPGETARYTSLLRNWMEVDNFLFVVDDQPSRMDFDIVNLGQGASGSVVSALTLDSLIDPNQADVLVYEFFLSDNWNLQESDVLKLELWMVRVKALYDKAARPVPPIMFLFLWESKIGQASREKLFSQGVDMPLHAAWQSIEHYRHQGWNIQTVSVGSAFNRLFMIAKDPQLIVDDVHHPSCYR